MVVFSRKYRWPEHFSVWSLGNSQKLLKTNQFLVSAIFFTIMNIFFFSFRFDLFSIIGNNVVCIVARLVFLFCCALTTGHCNAFQHNFEVEEIEALRPVFPDYVISCDYVCTLQKLNRMF